jgi:hypothetical protein
MKLAGCNHRRVRKSLLPRPAVRCGACSRRGRRVIAEHDGRLPPIPAPPDRPREERHQEGAIVFGALFDKTGVEYHARISVRDGMLLQEQSTIWCI